MKHVWSIICQSSSIDRQTNSLSLFNSIEEIHLSIKSKEFFQKNKNIFPIKFQIVSFWLVGEKDQELEIRIDLLDPKKERLSRFEKKFEVKGSDNEKLKRFKSRINIEGMPISGEGRYFFEIQLKQPKKKEYNIVAQIPLDVDISYKLDLDKK